MDETHRQSPARDSGRSTENTWRPTRSLINSLYVVVIIAGIGFSLGLAGLAMDMSTTRADSRYRSDSLDLPGYREKSIPQIPDTREHELRTRYLECARETSQQRMDLDSAVVCSQLADLLLAYSFGGISIACSSGGRRTATTRTRRKGRHEAAQSHESRRLSSGWATMKSFEQRCVEHLGLRSGPHSEQYG